MTTISAALIPDNIRERMSKEDRQKLGVLNREERLEKWEAGEEKKLQGHIANFLTISGIYFETDRMDKRPTGRVGRADFRLCYKGRFVALEAKTSVGKLSPEQVQNQVAVEKSGGIARTVRTVADVQAVLREIDGPMPSLGFGNPGK